jgi:hypothetical protein
METENPGRHETEKGRAGEAEKLKNKQRWGYREMG